MNDDVLIRLQAVNKSYQEAGREHVILRDLSSELLHGQSVALVGRSGTGKTTLLNLLGGIEQPDSGGIWIDGINISALSEKERTLFRRNKIGFVFQFFNLIPTLTVLENLLLPLSLVNRLDEGGRRRAEYLLREVGLQDRVNSYPDMMSGGEQQRVAIVRALVHQPSLILADEPTGNLDEESGDRVLQLLRRMVNDSNATLIMVTHSREIARISDRILTLRDGGLVEHD